MRWGDGLVVKAIDYHTGYTRSNPVDAPVSNLFLIQSWLICLTYYRPSDSCKINKDYYFIYAVKN